MAKAPSDNRGAPKGAFGNQPHERSDDIARKVQHCISIGLTQEQTASVCGVSVDTLARHYKPDLEFGAAHVNAKIGAKLFEKAMKGDTTALIWWTKARMGWKGTDSLEVPGGLTLRFGADDAAL